MNFRASFCDPFQKDIIDLGAISSDHIIEHFESILWQDYLQKMKGAKEEDIYYSPSFEIENSETKHGLSISAVGEPDNYEFYLFYKRPKLVKSFFGLKSEMKNGYLSDKTGCTSQDALDCLNALINIDIDFLERKFAG